MSKKHSIEVTRTVIVEIDETRFTPKVMADFNEFITYVGDQIEDHADYIAQQAIDNTFVVERGFMEGYGNLREVGVKVSIEETGEVLFDGLKAA